jgi:tRNA A-37 threonylcarbamoyl transferase component Bud32
MPLSNGTHLGSFEILAPIGEGGMGEVYKARDTRLDRTVAIKVLPEHLADKPQLRERFEREARAVSSLNHPHICTLHDVGQQDGVDYLVMEFLEGETLAHRLNKGALPLDQALRYAIEIAAALDHAHRHGVVHRDLKPGNIMLTKMGAKVLDFGLAKVGTGFKPAQAATMTLTEEGVILGTLQYMAPEQLEGKEADARTDIFAFGAVVYEMATGKKAFEGKSRASVMAAILERQPPPIASLQSLTPPALDHVVRTCMAKDPDARRQTAHDVMLELQWIAEGGSQAGVPAPVVAHRKNRERLAWGLVGVAVAAAIVLGFVAFRRPAPVVHPARFIVQAPEGAAFADEQNNGGASAISPDGRLLVFVATGTSAGANAQRLWVRGLDSLSAQPLAGTDDASYPFWSPDSHFIGFFAQGKLKRIDAGGRSVQTICDAPAGDRTSAWNQDGVILFSDGPILNRVPAAGGKPTAATVLDPTLKEVLYGGGMGRSYSTLMAKS